MWVCVHETVCVCACEGVIVSVCVRGGDSVQGNDSIVCVPARRTCLENQTC